MGSLVTTHVAGYVALRETIREFWPEAIRERLPGISGSPEDFITGSITQLTGIPPSTTLRARTLHQVETRTLAPSDVERLDAYVRERFQTQLLRDWAEHSASFLKRADAISRKAARAGWTEERYREAINNLAERYGSKGFTGAGATGAAAAFFFTKVVARGIHDFLQEALVQPAMRRLFPFREHITAQDDRVRPNHNFHGFIAATAWVGWRILMPPLGWNCRCVNRLISWLEARRRGLNTSLTFPLGLGALAGKQPGPDAGFQRQLRLFEGDEEHQALELARRYLEEREHAEAA